MVAVFPNVFMMGTAYKKYVIKINKKDCVHLLMKFTAIPSLCKMLIFYLFDLKQRHQNIRGMAEKVTGDPEAFGSFIEEFSSEEFQDLLQYAVAHPESKDAKYILNKLMPVLKTAGKHTMFGSVE